MQMTHTPILPVGSEDRLIQYLSQFDPFFRVGQSRWAKLYVRGLLLDGERKSIEPMMHRLELPPDCDTADPLQAVRHCVGHGSWEAEDLCTKLRLQMRGALDAPDAALILDDTPLLKQGKGSVGVGRQYNGTIGANANCQVVVTIHFSSPRGHCPVAGRLYLPEAWTNDPKRLDKAKVPPEHREPKTKIQIGLELLDQAIADLGKRIVLADAWYGDSYDFRQELERRELQYAVGVKSGTCVFVKEPRWEYTGRTHKGKPTRPRLAKGSPRAITLSQVAASASFSTRTWRQGTKGRLSGRFARQRVWVAHDWTHGKCAEAKPIWLVIEDRDGELKYYFSNLPEDTPFGELVRIIKSRWPVEQGYQQMKEELGLDHFEGRRWPGLHHHVALVFVAFGFLELERLRAAAQRRPNTKKK
jgi:SRSO17 transposase